MAAWLRGWYHPPCSVLWSRTALDAVGPWDEALTVNQDGDMMLRALAVGIPLVRTEQGAAYYRRLPGNAVSQSGQRLTREGVESRLRVLRNAAAMLRSKSMIFRYLDDLAVAFGTVAESCRGPHPDLAAVADDYARDPAAAALAVEPVRTDPTRAPADQPLPIVRTRDDPPLVSVVIPTYNRARLLTRALDSVVAQDYPRLEILVVDDASTDGTAAAVDAHGDPRIRYLRQAVNQGVAAARNRGMAEARGDFIALLDSDDEWLPGKITRQVEVFRRSPPRVGVVCTGVETVEGDGRRTRWHPPHRGNIFQTMLVRNVLHGANCSAMIRRTAVEVVGGFDGSLPAIEDWDYWLRLTRLFEVAHADEILTRYHDADSGDPDVDKQRRSRNFTANMDAREMLFRRYGHDLRREGMEHRFLLDSAGRHRASPHGSGAAATRLVLRAIRRQPLTLKQYGLLLPHRMQGPLQRIWHAVAPRDDLHAATSSPAGQREDGR